MEKIVDLQLTRVAARLADKHLKLKWEPQIVKHLAQEGYDPAFGARPLKRIIQQEVVNLFATALLEDRLPPYSEILLTGQRKESEFVLGYEVQKTKK